MKKRLIAQAIWSLNTSREDPRRRKTLDDSLSLNDNARKTSGGDHKTLGEEMQGKLQVECDEYKGPTLREI